jgi:hypothetical protein
VSFSLTNPAGGLRYHVRGFRYAETLWAPFRFALAEWLYAWEPPEQKIVVVGPSGGWCVQPFFYERFDEVVCLEPDPLAHVLFRRRLARAPLDHRPRLRFVRDDRLLADPAGLVQLLRAEGDAAILFSNVIGQLRVLLETTDDGNPRLAKIRDAVRRATEGRSWASFHDRVSGEIEPALEVRVDTDRRLDDAEILEHFYPVFEDEAGGIAKRQAVLMDHLTGGFFPAERPHAYFVWPLMPRQFHLIEATRARRAD